MDRTVSHLYIHIPFCITKCNYCSFVSYPHADATEVDNYLDLLKQEILLRKKKTHLALDTLYIGGGTPTFINPTSWQDFATFLLQNLTFNKNAEITVEANPCSLTSRHLQIFRRLGVNRISLGVQSFNDDELKMMGRCHSASQAQKAISACLAHGFRTSADLIYSLPHQKFRSFAVSLKKLVANGVGHISLYQLSLEKGTPWQDLPKDSLSDGYEEYRYATWYLKEKGFAQYEISNFAKPGEESCHNLAYWIGDDYIGVGVSAASFVNGVRSQNTNDIKFYENSIREKLFPLESSEKLSTPKAAAEAAILLLRTKKGIEKNNFASRFGLKIYNEITEKLKIFPQELVLQNDKGICLTEKGMRVANLIWQELL